MGFNMNVPIGDIKEKVSEKISWRCGTRMTKLFYKFPVSSNPIKFTKMELLDNDDVETMVALYCSPGSFDINLNIGYSNQYGGGLQIHPVIIGTDLLGEDGSDNNDCSDHEGKDFSDPDLKDVQDDINDEGQNDGNDHTLLVGNLSCGIVIRNDLGAYMSIVNLDDPESKELFVGQRFESKDECVNAIKRYSLKVSVDYKVPDSKMKIYDSKCWKLTGGCKWKVQAAFIQSYKDENQNILSIAFIIVERVNSESWEFFVENLRNVVTQDNVCIISNRSKGLVAATRRSGVPWRSVFCIKHITMNFYKEFKNANWRRQVVNMEFSKRHVSCCNGSGYELEPHQFKQRLINLEIDMQGVDSDWG
ncbi:hypothetical protein J1N35_004678 [Gossypium stocksii]|uniref:Transposase MuDR plant domain-containing protein n=1 Tax=Gossypium stocksii TaxID=47602 RepID=A0A9D4AI93_9ROSI|nr:hypothetical protein J1N35_004678 [Gossypium stocksii]